MADDWAPHADGYVKGNIGVFPYLFGAWEVWDKIDGEWCPRGGPLLYTTIEAAKAAAETN